MHNFEKRTHRFRIDVEIEEGFVEGIHVVEQGWVEDGRDQLRHGRLSAVDCVWIVECAECGHTGPVTSPRALSAPRRHHIPRTLHSTINRFTVLLYFHRIARTERLRPGSRTGNVVDANVPASTALSDSKFKFKNVLNSFI